MIQFNLLPDVKLAYIKARQTKRFVTLIAAGVTGLALTILILLFVLVNFLQKNHLNSLNNDIKRYSKELQGTQDINKILTIQNQLNNLTALHDKKVVASRLFDYIGQLTPAQANIGKLDVDFTINTISMAGTADNLSVVNKFADTLKFTNYKTSDNRTNKAFSDVVLSNFTRDDKKTQYQIDVKFDPVIFDDNSDVTLTVPNIISTRSSTERPADLFQSLEPAGGSAQ